LAALVMEEKEETGKKLPTEQFARHQALTEALREIENSTAIALRDENRISDEVFRTLQWELDLLGARQAGPSA